MKLIAEQDRKFIDMADLKIFHSIYPVISPPADATWGSVVRFDSKIILPGKQEIQNFNGSPLIIIRILLNGTAAYYDSTGYRKILNEKDALVISYAEEGVQSILFNYNETDDNELIEIWVTSKSREKRHHFFPARVNNEDGPLYAITVPILNTESIDLNENSWLWSGTFAKNTNHTINDISLTDRLILFVLSGMMTVNGEILNYQDGMIISLKEAINIHFEKETELLIIQMRDSTDNREEAK